MKYLVNKHLRNSSTKVLFSFVLMGIWLIFVSFKHPIKLTASLIEYNENTKMLSVECKVFIDDFEKSINKTLTKNIDLSTPTKEDKSGIEDYFEKYYTITINGKEMPLKYKASEVLKEYNVLTIKFSEKAIKLNKGDKILIENTLFFEEFGYLQSNRITIRIPPFITEDNHEALLNNYSINKTL
ncbi:MAG: DUF6702 family protein [Bacteroidota bacterium]|jgi:hypothetical protein